MVKVSGSQGAGPDWKPMEYTTSTYKPSDSNGYKYTGYKPQYKDNISNAGAFKPSKFEPTVQKYQYKEFKPTHVGIYGEKPREKRVYPKQEKPKKIARKPARTFESYRGRRGPDIRTGDIGPDYKPRTYDFTSYKPGTPLKPSNYSRDTVRTGTMYVDNKEPIKFQSTTGSYKLTEDNYGGMRHFKYGFIDDPLQMHKGDEPAPEKYKVKEKPKTPEEKPKPKEEEKPKRAETPQKKPETPKPKIIPAVIPVKTGPKTFKTTSTQHVPPEMKTIPTQTQAVVTKTSQTQYVATQTKAISIQTDTRSPSPKVVPLVMAGNISPAKKKTTSIGIQCSEIEKKVSVKGTQYEAQKLRAVNTQTSPLIFAPPPQAHTLTTRHKTPEYVKEYREPTPVYQAPLQQRSPSPNIIPVVAVAAVRRSPTPVRQRTPTPVQQHLSPPKEESIRSPSPKKESPPVIVPVVYKQPSPAKARQPTQPTNDRTPTPPKPPTPVKSADENSNSRWTPSPEVFIAPVPAPARQPSPVKPVVQPTHHSPSPVPVEKKNPSPVFRHPSPKPQTPPPPVVPTPRTQPAKSKSPKVFISPRVKTPPENASKNIPTESQAKKSRLPPEITAFIEAYDSAHGPAPSGTVKTVQRSLAVF